MSEVLRQMHLWARFQADQITKLLEFVPAECFDKTINHLFVRENVFKIHIAVDNLTSYSMMLDVNVLDSFMILRVLDENDSALIVFEDNNRLKRTKKSNLLK